MQYRWTMAEPFAGAADLARRVNTAPLVAQMLANRGIRDPEAAKAFLNPKLADLHDPQLLTGAVPAAQRIARAVADKQKIVLYGDYDVDGITGVAILHAILGMVGGLTEFYVPHRLDEGYGLNLQAVRKLIADGMKLLVTVDCGIGAAECVAEAAAAGVDVIVTDHHTPPAELPAALAIVHPGLPGQGYPNPDLSGSGAALKLAWEVARQICGRRRVDEEMRTFLLDATCLAALGTIADVVPLVGENRCLAVFGLRGLPASTHPGLRALLDSTNLAGGKLDAYDVGFKLAPRINACGRMGHARLAVELLTGASGKRAAEIADYLAKQNAERQAVERAITAEAVEMVASRGMDRDDVRAIVLAGGNWHGGVIGIVAARLVARFGRPAVLIATDDGDVAHGSGRSIEGFHMRNALAACSEHLLSFGGHAMAGGLKIRPDRIDAFAAALTAFAAEALAGRDMRGRIALDAETTIAALSYPVVEHVSRLAPFGQGNPAPVVALRRCRVVTPPRRMGRTGQTASLVLGQGGPTLRAVGFGMGDLADMLVGINVVDVAAEPVLNTYRGRTNIELILRDVAWR